MESSRRGDLEGHAFSAVGMVESEDVRVEGEALVIADFATVFAIADDGPAFVGEVDADLIFATREEEDLEEGAFFDYFDGAVFGGGELALSLV